MLVGGAGLPRSLFLAETFNAKQFVESRLQGTLSVSSSNGDEDGRKLDSVVRDLKETVQDLTDQLLALIDRDHQTFLELSGDLVRVDATVGTLRAPLTHLKDKVEAVKRATSGPADAIREFDEKLAAIREKKKQIKEKMFARALRQSIEKDLLTNNETHAAQKLALLSLVVPETECAELRRDLEHRLADKLLEVPKEEAAARLRAFVMMGSVESARRLLHADLSHHVDEEVLTRVLTNYKTVLEAAASEGLGIVFEFPSNSILPALKLSVGKIASSKEARKAEAFRAVLAHFSPSGTPHTPLRWNPRMHCELRFQDAVQVFEKGSDLNALRQALVKLYEEELPRNEMEKDILLAAHLFRMACRLVSGYLGMLEEEQLEEHLLIAHTQDVFKLKRELELGQVIFPPKNWSGGDRTLKALSSRAGRVGSTLLGMLKKSVVDLCAKEINALDRVVTTTYRMTGKPLGDSFTPNASKITSPLLEILDQLLDSAERPEGIVEWTQSILEQLRVQFLQMAESVTKRETSLLRYHQRTQSTGMSDSVKITKQLAMDSDKFVSDVVNAMEKKLQVKGFDRQPYLAIVKQFQEFEHQQGTKPLKGSMESLSVITPPPGDRSVGETTQESSSPVVDQES